MSSSPGSADVNRGADRGAAANPDAVPGIVPGTVPGTVPGAAAARPNLPSRAQLEASYRQAAAAVAAAGTPHPEVVQTEDWDVFSAVALLRLAIPLAMRTFFQPDEYFQVLEPAWQLVYGPASGAWITWEWREHLRTSLHPVLFAGVYAVLELVMSLLHIVGPMRTYLLTVAPGLAQAVFAALVDFYTWQLAAQVYGRSSNSAWAALWLCIVSPWHAFVGTRTFSNSLEATLTAAALAYWPWQLFDGKVDGNALFANGGLRRLRISLLLAATAVVLRPTNILIWAALLTLAVTRMTLDGPPSASSPSAASSAMGAQTLVRLLAEIAGCGSLVLAVAAVSDRFFYGVWTFPLYTFFDINLTRDVAVFYGRNPWHYYLVQGLPLLTTTGLPFVLQGLYSALTPVMAPPSPPDTLNAAGVEAPDAMPPTRRANTRRALAFATVTAVGALSLVAHKEVRFLYPLLPVVHVLAAPHVASYFTKLPTPTPAPAPKVARPSPTPPSMRRGRVLAGLLAVNGLLVGYLTLFHQPAPLAVLRFLRGEYERIHHDWLERPAGQLPFYDTYPAADWLLPSSEAAAAAAAAAPALASDGDGDELFALFLVPCHSTPWRSHLVYPGLRARALTCEPPLHTAPRSAARAAYVDEADRFYAAPGAFLATELWPVVAASDDDAAPRRAGERPRYIVGFEGIEAALADFFGADGAGADMGVTLRRAWTGWNGLANEDWRRRGQLVVWDTGVYANTSHPDAERTYEEVE